MKAASWFDVFGIVLGSVIALGLVAFMIWLALARLSRQGRVGIEPHDNSEQDGTKVDIRQVRRVIISPCEPSDDRDSSCDGSFLPTQGVTPTKDDADISDTRRQPIGAAKTVSLRDQLLSSEVLGCSPSEVEDCSSHEALDIRNEPRSVSDLHSRTEATCQHDDLLAAHKHDLDHAGSQSTMDSLDESYLAIIADTSGLLQPHFAQFLDSGSRSNSSMFEVESMGSSRIFIQQLETAVSEMLTPLGEYQEPAGTCTPVNKSLEIAAYNSEDNLVQEVARSILQSDHDSSETGLGAQHIAPAGGGSDDLTNCADVFDEWYQTTAL